MTYVANSTSFTPETAPRPGGKKGRRWKRKHTLAKEEVDRRVEEMFADMDNLAAENVKSAIQGGNAKISMWYLELRAKHGGTRLQKGLLRPLIDAVDSLEDAEMISKQALLLAIDGDMTFEELKAVQEAVARHATFSGMVALQTLRADLDALREETDTQPQVGMGHAPAWGRLNQAEDAELVEDKPKARARANGKAGVKAKARANGKAKVG